MINNMPFIGSELVAMHPIKDTWPAKITNHIDWESHCPLDSESHSLLD